jgi:hypothetical protein
MDSTQMKLSMAQGLSVLRRLGLVAVLLATIPIGFLAFGMSEDSLGSWATLLGLAVTAGLALGGWLMFWGQGYATDRRAMKAATPPSPQEGRWTAVCGIARPVEAAFDEEGERDTALFVAGRVYQGDAGNREAISAEASVSTARRNSSIPGQRIAPPDPNTLTLSHAARHCSVSQQEGERDTALFVAAVFVGGERNTALSVEARRTG